ncbi:hypothetical protein Ahy_B03g064909 [Arachis hypogaea]|uniref:Uncharacterized protein n=1 Tax=Arachis hypogaea TaxID=3818 RepID=A0A445A0I1_ARAHY|nr:hypothetical protein Ahy_B03g064909 [Arachis hypogaea]
MVEAGRLKYHRHRNDRVTASFFRSHNSNDSVVTVDEIQNYYDCRYISTCEDSWRLFGFEIQFKEPNVIRLPFHLLNEQNILYEDHQLIENVIESAESKDNMFIGWMEVNNKFDAARRLTFAEMPSYFVWDKQGHIWKPRKQGHVIGRLIHIPQSHREEYYLHMLLNYQKGCQTFADIQSVDGVVHDTYKQACYAIGLLQDDKKFIDAINEASSWASPSYIRRFFAMLLMSNNIIRPDICFVTFIFSVVDLGFERFANEIMSTTLAKIEELLQLNGRTLKEFSDLPFPDLLDSVEPRDTVFLDELNFNKNDIDGESVIRIPDKLLLDIELPALHDLVLFVYPDVLLHISSVDYFKDRSILAPTLDVVMKVNNHVMSLLPGNEKVYLSSDTLLNEDGHLESELYTMSTESK